MPLPEAARDYLLKALDGTPVVLRSLLRGLDDENPVWDQRPDPDRFTLREILAHLADWEPIWLERVTRMSAGGKPFLPSVDEAALAVENMYSESLPSASLRSYSEGRDQLVAFLKSLPDGRWDFKGAREFVGELTLQQQVAMAISHDMYHLRQVAEWLQQKQSS